MNCSLLVSWGSVVAEAVHSEKLNLTIWLEDFPPFKNLSSIHSSKALKTQFPSHNCTSVRPVLKQEESVSGDLSLRSLRFPSVAVRSVFFFFFLNAYGKHRC